MNLEKQLKFISEQLFVQGNIELVDSFFDASYIAHDGDKVHKGQIFVKQFIKKLRSAIPDIDIVKIEFLSQSGNTITWQRTFRGTHKTNMQGIPASNKTIKWNEIVVTRFIGDKVAEDWLVSNLAFQLMMQQTKKK
jgi:predicted ester cyclase